MDSNFQFLFFSQKGTDICQCYLAYLSQSCFTRSNIALACMNIEDDENLYKRLLNRIGVSFVEDFLTNVLQILELWQLL